MIKIGKLKIRSKILLAPMSGITDFPFRMISREFGCRFAFTEMIDAGSLSYSSERSIAMLRTSRKDRPLGLQLLAENEEHIKRAVEKLDRTNFELIDLNAACPQPKVTKKGKGAFLLKEPKKLKKLLETLIECSGKPVTAKIRLGWDNAANAVKIARYAEQAGISALFVHGRTRTRLYRRGVDYRTIGKIKKTLNIPVIGSGDIFTPEQAKRMMDETGCDGVLVARGSFGNPWIFEDIENYLKKNELPPVRGAAEVARVMKKHLKKYLRFYDNRLSVITFRKFYCWYTKGFSHIKPIRAKIHKVTTPEAMIELIDEFKKGSFHQNRRPK